MVHSAGIYNPGPIAKIQSAALEEMFRVNVFPAFYLVRELLPAGPPVPGAIDPEGVLKYAVVTDDNVGSSVDETIRVLQALQTGGLCPAEWKTGKAPLQKV